MDHRAYLASIGRKGGQSRSPAKTEAARRNGTRPKRPRRQTRPATT